MGNSIIDIIHEAINIHRSTSFSTERIAALVGDNTFRLLEQEIKAIAKIPNPTHDPVISVGGTPVYPFEAPGTSGIIIGPEEVILRMRKAFVRA